MFEDSLVESGGKLKTKSKYWMILTFSLNAIFVAVLIRAANMRSVRFAKGQRGGLVDDHPREIVNDAWPALLEPNVIRPIELPAKRVRKVIVEGAVEQPIARIEAAKACRCPVGVRNRFGNIAKGHEVSPIGSSIPLNSAA